MMKAGGRMRVTTYEEMLALLEEIGFMGLGNGTGYLSLESVTDPEAWHRGDERDPWEWKDRIAKRRDGAYARVFRGKPALISPAWYPIFRAAFETHDELEARYQTGQLDPMTRRLAQCFARRPIWARHELTAELGVGKAEKSRFESALARLQGEMRITPSGTAPKIAASGEIMGWPSLEYTRVDVWMPAEWGISPLSSGEARAKIAEQMQTVCPELDARAMRRLIGA